MIKAFEKGLNEYNKPFLFCDNTNVKEESQKINTKKVNSIKPKGDIELKNIQYRIFDKRYIGRKQINNKTITVYAKTQKDCLKKLNEAIKNFNNPNKITKTKGVLFIDYWNKWYE